MSPQLGPKQTIPTRLMNESNNQIEKFVHLWGVRLGPELKKKKTCRGPKHSAPRRADASPKTRSQHEHVSPGLTENTTITPRPYLPPGSTADHHGITDEAQLHYTPDATQSTTDRVDWAQPHSTATQTPSHWYSGQVAGPNVAEDTHGPSYDFYPSMYDASHAQEHPQDHSQYQSPHHHGHDVVYPQRTPEDAYASPAQYGSGMFPADPASSSLATRGPGESEAPLFAVESDSEMPWSETFPVPPHDYRAYAMQPQGMYYTPSSGGSSMGGEPVIQQIAGGGWYPDDNSTFIREHGGRA